MKKAFSMMANDNVRAFFVLVKPAFGAFQDKIIGLAGKSRLPGMYSTQAYVSAGGLMSYAPDRIAIARRQAVYVDKILKGAKPADLPVEQPMKFFKGEQDKQAWSAVTKFLSLHVGSVNDH